MGPSDEVIEKPRYFSGGQIGRESRWDHNGPIAAFARALESAEVPVFEVCDYREQAMGRGVEASAIAYICIRTPDGKIRWGAGVNTSIELASIKAVLSALNRL